MLERPTAMPVTTIPEGGEATAADCATGAFEEPLLEGEEANVGTGVDSFASRVGAGVTGPMSGRVGALPAVTDGPVVAGDVAAGTGCAVFVSTVEGPP